MNEEDFNKIIKNIIQPKNTNIKGYMIIIGVGNKHDMDSFDDNFYKPEEYNFIRYE